ncbi:exotoxin (plasmid) [Serratia marcescens]|nr:exotoxin [Serratia marcescens]
MMRKRLLPQAGLWGVSAALLLAVTPAKAVDNLRFYGALVAEPCVIAPGYEDIPLEFGTIVDRYLYLNTRTPGQTFEIRLADCDLNLGKLVTVTFTGTENAALPGLLAIDGSGGARGIAIGLETPDSTLLPINQAGGKISLVSGSNVIALKAYVRGEPEAIRNQRIELGTFGATATFRLEYE